MRLSYKRTNLRPALPSPTLYLWFGNRDFGETLPPKLAPMGTVFLSVINYGWLEEKPAFGTLVGTKLSAQPQAGSFPRSVQRRRPRH